MNQRATIARYSHLNKFPREKEALQMLKRIASLVKPIMRARRWKVGTLAEFYPSEQRLLGINVNRGERICLRLRSARDQKQFLHFEQIMDTMLHELCHNVFGPHDANFHALWDMLRLEHEGLIRKGYTGLGFLSEGRRLGGRIAEPILEAREIASRAAAAAEKRRSQNLSSGQRLRGFPVPIFSEIRGYIHDAIQIRAIILNGCRFGDQNQREIQKLATQATRNGFSSQAEEDEANEQAISQALWELVQEDLARENRDTNRSNNLTRIKSPVKTSGQNMQMPKHEPAWDCPFCTLCNPVNFLACEACNKQRPSAISRYLADKQNNLTL